MALDSSGHNKAIIMFETLTRVYDNVAPPTQSVLRLRGAPDTEVPSTGGLTVTPVMVNGDSVFGAEVSGIDWSKPVPEETVQEVNMNASAGFIVNWD